MIQRSSLNRKNSNKMSSLSRKNNSEMNQSSRNGIEGMELAGRDEITEEHNSMKLDLHSPKRLCRR